ncbi:MAG: glycosyltransferase family 2 protein [Lachnospiraceae bacterium]|nr:glycosyltransferase family 2 protein [Lachnospiraceae bacterium]
MSVTNRLKRFLRVIKDLIFGTLERIGMTEMNTDSAPKLSIIVPHYNRPIFLSRLLDTIPNCSSMEVLVIDDHSTKDLNDLQKCMHKYSGRNITFYESDPGKKGPGVARNVGIKHAKGEYLLFADSDDWFMPGWDATIEEALSCGADVIFFPPTSRSLDGKISFRHKPYAELVDLYRMNPSQRQEIRLRYKFISPCSKLIRRRMVEENRIWFDEIQYGEDMIFSAKVGYYARVIQAFDRKIYCILEHEGSITKITDRNVMVFRYKIENK